jgi:heat-inducible transcriptional repressor
MKEETTQERQQAILTEIIRFYLTRHKAISARTLSKISALSLSPTTIRNLMEDLSLEGFLTSEGVSRGRIPTQKAFAVYVTHLQGVPPSTRQPVPVVDLGGETALPTLQDALDRTGRFLADQTGFMALAALPDKDRYPLHWVRLVPIADDRVLVAVQSVFGDLWSKVVRSAEPLPPELLREVEGHICSRYHGAPMERIRHDIMAGAPMHFLEDAPSMGSAFRVLRQAFDWDKAPGWQVWGAEHIYRIPEYQEPEKMLRIHRALEDPTLLSTVFRRARAVEGGRVSIGTETGYRGLEDSSVVGFPFASDGWQGTMALLGPMRMDYPLVFQLVANAAAALERSLQETRSHAGAPCP